VFEKLSLVFFVLALAMMHW